MATTWVPHYHVLSYCYSNGIQCKWRAAAVIVIMPILKAPRKREPPWKQWDKDAQKEGVRAPVYSVNGDVYTGEWSDNKKHGKGTQVWKKTGAIYEGDWENDLRHGFGTYNVLRNGEHAKQYAGGWKNDMRHGYGTNFYSEEEYYEGEWYADKRSGWGRMYYSNGSVYEGEWYNDQRSGRGILKLASGNRYEGMWERDMKNGDGKFLYLNKGQVYTGTWKDDVAKCGKLEDFDREGAPDPPVYPLPICTLVDPRKVLEEARESINQ